MDPIVLVIPLLFMSTTTSAEWDSSKCAGRCVVLGECELLHSMVNKTVSHKDAIEILKKHTCDYEGRDPKVCCPETVDPILMTLAEKDCLLPNGDIGTCTKLEDCGLLDGKQWNINLIPLETMEFIKRSKCSVPGTSATSVCCNKEKTSQITNIRLQKGCSMSAFPPALGSKCCGIESNSEPRIFGGNETAIDQFPWLVMIEYSRPGYACGGFLISGKYVLTAAHCMVGVTNKTRGAVSVRVGEYNATNRGEDCVEAAGGGWDCTDGAISIPIERVIVHPDYAFNHVLKFNDIALIRLETMVNYTDFVRPICLPSSDFTTSSPDNLELFISGWGTTETQVSSDVKLFLKVPYVQKKQCDSRYSDKRETLIRAQLCAGGKVLQDSCTGDSGGPLMLLKKVTYEAAGVISFGPKNCGTEKMPSVYTKVYDYIDWIRDNIET